jgi:hypothetical protein
LDKDIDLLMFMEILLSTWVVKMAEIKTNLERWYGGDRGQLAEPIEN